MPPTKSEDNQIDEILGSAKLVEEEVETESDSPQEPTCTPTDPGWTQYVLGHFDDDEMDKGNPRVEGLRRVTELLMGTITEEGCQLVSSPTHENGMRACAKAWVEVSCGYTGSTIRFEALADACPENCIGDYASYLVAMADTRAKGRCYRNLLKLKRVVSAEEIDATLKDLNHYKNDGDPIEPSQIAAIDMMACRIGVSMDKLIESKSMECDKNEDGTFNIASLTKGVAKILLSSLNRMSTSNEVPDGLKGD